MIQAGVQEGIQKGEVQEGARKESWRESRRKSRKASTRGSKRESKRGSKRESRRESRRRIGSRRKGPGRVREGSGRSPGADSVKSVMFLVVLAMCFPKTFKIICFCDCFISELSFRVL